MSNFGVFIFEENTDTLLEEERKSQNADLTQDLKLSEVTSYSGNKASSVRLLVLDGNTLLDRPEIVTTILEKVLQPKGKLVIRVKNELTSDLGTKLSQQLKFSGFVGVTLNDGGVLAEKDQFEVGESVKLNLNFAPKSNGKAPTAWKVSLDDDDVDEENDELIDDEDLLDADDLKKPDPASLRVCGTTGKRKACKDCSCGLAEELEGEERANAVAASNGKSSCGSCYLGDAFRCATCPYLGTPAFKPGEKIQLSDAMLQPDL